MDFALAILPVSIVWNLKMNIKRKVGLCILLGLGILYVSHHFLDNFRGLIREYSASISAAIKTSQLSSLDSRADLTCELYLKDCSEITDTFIGATFGLYAWTG